MKRSHLILTALTAGALAGCASAPPRQTTADLTRAHTLVAAAESSDAQQYAAADLQAARDKATEADQEAKHDATRADRLANEAAVDAELASARAQDAKAQHSLADLHRNLESLRNEAQRNTNTPPTGAAPAQSQPSPSGTSPLEGVPPASPPAQQNQTSPTPPPPGTTEP